MKIKFIDKSLILENGIKFTFGMTKSEVAKLLKGYEYLYGKMHLIYPKKIRRLDETYQYEQLGNIRLRYLDDSLFLFHIPVKSNELFYHHFTSLFNCNISLVASKLNCKLVGFLFGNLSPINCILPPPSVGGDVLDAPFLRRPRRPVLRHKISFIKKDSRSSTGELRS